MHDEERERLLDAFRRWGYLEAKLDPLGCLRPQPHPELELRGAAQADIHWIVGPTSYNTNEAPPAEPVLLSFLWNPKNFSACARNFGRAATALRLTLQACSDSAPVDARQIETLDSTIKQWSHCLDPAAKSELATSTGITFD